MPAAPACADARTAPEVDWVGRLDEPARSVDQRLKLAAWAELFARGGGRVLRHRVTPDDLVPLRADHELVVIAAGRGELAGIFRRDERRHARQVTAWSRVMLTGPHHVWELYRLADRHQPTADRFANSFGDPAGLIDWFLHPERATAYVDGVRRTVSMTSSHVPIS